MFEGQLDVESDGGDAHLACSPVARFHDAGTTPRHDGVALVAPVGPLAQLRAEFPGGVVVACDLRESVEPRDFLLVPGGLELFLDVCHGKGACGPEEDDGVFHVLLLENLVGAEEFREDSDGAADFAVHEFGVMVNHLAHCGVNHLFLCHRELLFLKEKLVFL